MKTIGILGLQGGFNAHAKVCEKLDAPYKYIRTKEQFATIDALIIPGGESTTLLKLFSPLIDALTQFHKQGKPILTTCAGTILIAKNVTNPHQESFGLIDCTIKRNAYGRQIDSFISKGEADPEKLGNDHLTMVFIRAPQIIELGDKVEILATCNKKPVLVQQGNVLSATFHPELTLEESFVHKYFLSMLPIN